MINLPGLLSLSSAPYIKVNFVLAQYSRFLITGGITDGTHHPENSTIITIVNLTEVQNKHHPRLIGMLYN